MSDKKGSQAPNEKVKGDVIFMPGMPLPTPGKTDFEKKHWLALCASYFMANPEVKKKHDTSILIASATSAFLFLSLALNYTQAHYPRQPQVMVSMSNDSHDLIRMATINVPLNTTQIATDWAQNAVCDILTFGFSNYDDRLRDVKHYFTDAGFAGYEQALREGLLKHVIQDGLMITTAPTKPPIISHYPTSDELYWLIQIPVVNSFSRGNQETDRSANRLITVKVVPVRPSTSYYGKAIDSITIESGGT